MNSQKFSLTVVGLLVASIFTLRTAAGAQTFAYPPAGRTPDQQRQDQFECHQWAVEQSLFDPTQQVAQPAAPAPKPEPGRASSGVIGGAARGAVVANATDEDSEDGARAGAALGLLRQRRAQTANAGQQLAATQQQMAQQQQAQLQGKQNYERARDTCLKARGYTLSN